MKTTLCIMAKNEGKVIDRALHSALPAFSHVALLLDDQTTDDTLEVVVRFCEKHDRRLTVLEAPWKNYGYNRNELLKLGRATGAYWLMLLDADNYFAFDQRIERLQLDKNIDCYEITCAHMGLTYYKVAILKASAGFYYELPTHEGFYCKGKSVTGRADLVVVIDGDGVTRHKDIKTYLHDASQLLEYLTHFPKDGNPLFKQRATFYLAQSFRSAGMDKEAITWYMQRAALGGWDEEVFISYLEIAKAMERLGAAFFEVGAAYFAAYLLRPTRAEPIWYLISFLRKAGKSVSQLEALLVSDPPPGDILFIEGHCYSKSIPDHEHLKKDPS